MSSDADKQRECEAQEIIDRLKQSVLEDEVWWVKRPDSLYLIECRVTKVTGKIVILKHITPLANVSTSYCCFKRSEIEFIEKSVRP